MHRILSGYYFKKLLTCFSGDALLFTVYFCSVKSLGGHWNLYLKREFYKVLGYMIMEAELGS